MDQESSTKKKKEISLGSALEKNRSGKKPAVTGYLWARKPDRWAARGDGRLPRVWNNYSIPRVGISPVLYIYIVHKKSIRFILGYN